MCFDFSYGERKKQQVLFTCSIQNCVQVQYGPIKWDFKGLQNKNSCLIRWEWITKGFLKTWASIWPHSQANRNTELRLHSLRVGVLKPSVQWHNIESDKPQKTLWNLLLAALVINIITVHRWFIILLLKVHCSFVLMGYHGGNNYSSKKVLLSHAGQRSPRAVLEQWKKREAAFWCVFALLPPVT